MWGSAVNDGHVVVCLLGLVRLLWCWVCGGGGLMMVAVVVGVCGYVDMVGVSQLWGDAAASISPLPLARARLIAREIEVPTSPAAIPRRMLR